jgi:uncharacterized protein (TIGR02246 family)
MRPADGFRIWLPLMLLAALFPGLTYGQGIEKPRVPVRYARDEIRVFRESYQDAYNKKDTVTVADMYAPDAVVIQGNGNVLSGHDAIQKQIATDAPKWTQISIMSDTLRVVGNTAWDIGTSRTQGPDGKEQVAHYLTVLRRGIKAWKIDRLAVVPEGGPANPADSTARR